MKNKTLIIAISLIAVVGYAYADDVAENLSDVKFKSVKAKIAQKRYNNTVEKAWKKYQNEVRNAEDMYIKELKVAMEEEIKKENLEEASNIQKEIRRHHLDIQRGLILHYSFEKADKGGRVLDKSGKGNYGKVHGAKWTSNGKVGGAYQFDIDKKTDCIQVPDTDSLDVEKITISAWIKTTCEDKHWNRIMDKDYRKGYNMCLGGDYEGKNFRGKLLLEINGHWNQSDNIVADGKWHHVAGTFDGSMQKLYVDGQQQKHTTKWKGAIAANEYDLAIGNSKIPYGTGEFLAFDGTIDEVMIFNRALSSKEVKLLYESQKQPRETKGLLPDQHGRIRTRKRN